MPEYKISLGDPLPAAVADEFAKCVFFADEAITDLQFVRERGLVTALLITTDSPVEPGDLARKVGVTMDDNVRRRSPGRRTRIWTSRNPRTGAADMAGQLTEQGTVFRGAAGDVALGAPFLALIDRADHIFRRLAVEQFDAREFAYPTLIAIRALQRCGYLEVLPQRAIFAARPRRDADGYRSLSEQARTTGRLEGALDRCAEVSHCLTPAQCIHTFNQFADTVLPARIAAVTSRGRVFRHEAKHRPILGDLWDFTVREIVFAGSRDFVLRAQRRLMRQLLEITDLLGLGGRSEAVDPLFPPAAAAGVTPSSRRFEAPRYELLLNVSKETAVAVASFNFHERFYGESFAITTPCGEPAYTACVSISLERFAYAFISQYGNKASAWPESVKYILRSSIDLTDHTIGNGH